MKNKRKTHPQPLSRGERTWLSPLKRGLRGVFVFGILLSSLFTTAQTATQTLSANWQFRQVGTQVWYPATVPGTVHTDLLANGLIDDPFANDNEKKLQWIERKNWEYRCTFDVPENQFQHKNHELFFEGLDTYAEVFLNGERILDANNMFRSWRVDVAGNLKEKGNELRIVFTSPIVKNDSIARANVKLPGGNDTSEYPVWPYTRKAAYHFGWDFAPRFVTCGVWKEIYLQSWKGLQVDDVNYSYNLDSISADIIVWLIINSEYETAKSVYINDHLFEIDLKKGKNEIRLDFKMTNIERWWPNGSGSAKLYKFAFGFYNGVDKLPPSDEQTVGFRTIELINDPDSIGTNFYFKINGKPIFMQGANYVPQDVFLPRVQDSQYVQLLTWARDAGMNMIRVWGGGVYERDIFYDLCDEYGILVWQDYMFAGTIYPYDSLFLDNVWKECIEQTLRLNKHTCLALWCGNNEIEVAWKNWSWQKQYGYSTKDSTRLWRNYNTMFNYNIEAISVIFSHLPMPYVPTSPQSNWGTPENFNHGSMHYWGVWHGPDDFSGYEKNIGRFMVEWGFQSYPDYDLLAEHISPEFLALNSEVMKNRQKSYVGNGKITDFLQQYNFDFTDFKTFAQQSQNLQALGYEMALKSHIAAQPHCMGTLLWQLNDCWPGPSWSIINFNGTPKAAYWRVKEVLKKN
jgi:beta-mannosidase